MFRRPLRSHFQLAFIHNQEFPLTLNDGRGLRFSRPNGDHKFWDWFFESLVPVEFTADGLLRIQWEGRPVLLRPASTDFFIFKEVFIDDVYGLRSLQGPLGTVLDLGANAGMFASAVAPKCQRVVAVEPVRENYNLARENLRQNHKSPDDVLRLAVSAVSGQEVTIHHHQRNTGGHSISADRVPQTGMTTHETVPTVSIADLIARCGGKVDLLKCDVEGSEYDAFLAASPADLARIGRLVMEVHLSPAHPPEILRRLLGHLKSGGFDVSLDAPVPTTDQVAALHLTGRQRRQATPAAA